MSQPAHRQVADVLLMLQAGGPQQHNQTTIDIDSSTHATLWATIQIIRRKCTMPYEISKLPANYSRANTFGHAANSPAMYPFAAMDVKDCFFVPAEQKPIFNRIRCAASKYARKAGVILHCDLLQDGRLCVWRDADDPSKPIDLNHAIKARERQQNAPASTSAVMPQPAIVQMPTKAQFLAYCASMSDGQSFILQASQYDDPDALRTFELWTEETEHCFARCDAPATLTIVSQIETESN